MRLLVTNIERESRDDRRFSFEPVGAPRSLTNTQGMQITAGYISFEERGMHKKELVMTVTNQFAVHVGLDWADKKHDVCVQFKNGERMFHVIKHTAEALDIWLPSYTRR